MGIGQDFGKVMKIQRKAAMLQAQQRKTEAAATVLAHKAQALAARDRGVKLLRQAGNQALIRGATNFGKSKFGQRVIAGLRTAKKRNPGAFSLIDSSLKRL